MVTLVGTEIDFFDTLKNLIELDYDAIAAYDTAIEKIENPTFKAKLREFKEDHARHTELLTAFLHNQNKEAPSGPSMKHYLTEGKVRLGNLMGDKAILMAMRSNEEDTNTAYERSLVHEQRLEAVVAVLERNLGDERRHRKWLQDTLNQL